MRQVIRQLGTALCGIVCAATVASAQTVTFSTVGSFSGGCTGASCAFGNFTLSFENAPSANYLAPSLVDLGNFVTSFTGASGGTAPSTPIPAGVNFTLTINQTSPSAGSQSTSGTVAGSLAYNPSQSSLFFTPSTNSVTIGGVTYSFVLDNNGRLNIAAPTVGANPNTTVFKANISTVPEPSTYALLASGIAGLGVIARRRRSQV